MLEIFARAEWYLARAEPEREWRGILHPRPVVIGPATRTALPHTLETDGGAFAVYTATAADQLTPYVGLPITARGKLVHLREEGLEPELWLASIERA